MTRSSAPRSLLRTAAAIVILLAVLAGTSRAEADSEAHELPAQGRSTLGAKLEVGGSYRSIFSLPVAGGEVSAALGALPKVPKPSAAEIYLRARYGLGRTEHGLAVHAARVGGQVEFALGRFRPSFGADLMWLAIDRFTKGGLVQHWGLGFDLGATIDVVQTTEHQALYVGPRVDLDIFPHKLVPRTLSANGAIALGYRF